MNNSHNYVTVFFFYLQIYEAGYPSFIVNDHHGQLLVLDDDITLSANEDVRTVYVVKLSESTNSEDLIWKVQDGKLLS